MKSLGISLLLAVSLALTGSSQGIFLFDNHTAPTRVGTIDGPLAGPGFWGQALMGVAADSLTPLGPALEHNANGVVGADLIIPAPQGAQVFVQLAAWNGNLWGTNFAGIPLDQQGHTDIVPVLLVFGPDGGVSPRFTQPAIVPVPEPSAAPLAILGCAVLVLRLRFPKRSNPSGPGCKSPA